MDNWNQPGFEYDALTPAQRAQADVIFLGVKMREHTYDVVEGVVQQWRYFKPSEFCLKAIEYVLTGK